MEELGFTFHTADDGAPYWDETGYYEFKPAQINELERASYALNEMCLAAVEHVIQKGLWDQFRIPAEFGPWIAWSWTAEERTIIGRFDLAYDGTNPPRMLEYNADTPTSLLEASVVQWQWCRDVFGGDIQVDQYNSIHERLIEAWQALREDAPMADRLTFFTISDAEEDRVTTAYLRDTAIQAGSSFRPFTSVKWSPEDPFLYDVVADCGTDRVTERFGMRTFKLDQASGRAMLNGKPYFMRGSNITLYRFFEDDARGALPWDKEWVRGLHKMVRDMHWNSLRYCIGFPPDFWYDIADEEGVLICDEFPIWNARHGEIPNDNDPQRLISEYTDWMRDRWNHPCVILWDAQNETHSTTTSIAIEAVRELDLSNRPWDNGYSRYRPAGDSFESHAYLFNKRYHNGPFELKDLEWHPGTPLGNAGGANENDNPIIINEYAWVWINRDGSPTRLGRPVFARLLKGQKATPAEYRHLNARLIAALTEFWRSHRQCAGILHFCILGYSRPDGHTSDHFTDVKGLKLEPEFAEHVRDSFAPVGVMINFFTPEVKPNERRELGVALVNDLYEDWTGQVRLEVLRDGKQVQEHVQTCTVPALGDNQLLFPVQFPRQKGEYQLRATIIDADGEEVSSWRDVRVDPQAYNEAAALPGIAVGKPATASSVTELGNFPPEMAFDGDPETRWASEYTTPQWLMVDLQKEREVYAVDLTWENAFAKAYSIEVSTDGENWKTVHETDNGYGQEPIIHFEPTPARYVRLTVTENGTRWGASLWEMKVF